MYFNSVWFYTPNSLRLKQNLKFVSLQVNLTVYTTHIPTHIVNTVSISTHTLYYQSRLSDSISNLRTIKQVMTRLTDKIMLCEPLEQVKFFMFHYHFSYTKIFVCWLCVIWMNGETSACWEICLRFVNFFNVSRMFQFIIYTYRASSQNRHILC